VTASRHCLHCFCLRDVTYVTLMTCCIGAVCFVTHRRDFFVVTVSVMVSRVMVSD